MGQEAKRCITWKAFCRFSKRHWYRCPLAFFEWLSSVAIGYLAKVRLVRALEYVGKLALLGALVVWFYPGCNQRKQAVLDARDGKHFQAWQLIDAAYGKPGEDGRSFALVVLNQDNISLQRIDVSGATLPGIQLPYADLRGAVFKNADLTQADFRGAYLSESDFSGANVFQADFSGARMKDVKFDIDPRSLSTGGFIKMSNAVIDGTQSFPRDLLDYARTNGAIISGTNDSHDAQWFTNYSIQRNYLYRHPSVAKSNYVGTFFPSVTNEQSYPATENTNRQNSQ